jgi:hypothetical protein
MYLDVPFLIFSGRFWLTPLIVGLYSIVMTPLVAERHLAALEQTSPSNQDNEVNDDRKA